MRWPISAMLLALSLTSCAAAGERAAGPQVYAAALVGVWDNDRQMALAPIHFRGEGTPGTSWIAPRVATITPGATPGALRVVWRRGGDPKARTGAGELVAEEDWRFSADGLVIGPAGAPPEPGCAMTLRPLGGAYFDAASDPMTCTATAPDGRRRALQRRVTATTTGLLAQDIWFDAPDEIAFKVPGAAPVELIRRP